MSQPRWQWPIDEGSTHQTGVGTLSRDPISRLWFRMRLQSGIEDGHLAVSIYFSLVQWKVVGQPRILRQAGFASLARL